MSFSQQEADELLYELGITDKHGRVKETPHEYNERKTKNILERELRLPPSRIKQLLELTYVPYQRGMREHEHGNSYQRALKRFQQENLADYENRKRRDEEAKKRGYAEMDTSYDSGTGSESERESAEEHRVRAMQPKKVEEKVAQQVVADRVDDATELMRQMAIGKGGIDRSDIYSSGLKGGNAPTLEGGSTGMSQHIQYGEKHARAKLNDELAQKIRREYWSGGLKKSGQKREGSYSSLAEKYGVSLSSVKTLIGRETWIHLPQVEGEPDENMERLSVNEKKVIERAKELGVEPIRNKIGRLALPEDVVLKLRSEASKKGHAGEQAIKVKPELTEEEKAEKKRIASEKRRATIKAKMEKKKAEKE